MMPYCTAAMVKAMKIQEGILKAASKKILWTDAADIIGVSYRTMKRWKARYEEGGYDGIFDRRMRRPSPKRALFKEVEVILALYREKYMGFNVSHFHEKPKVTFSRSFASASNFMKSSLRLTRIHDAPNLFY